MKEIKYTHDTITHNTQAAEEIIPFILDFYKPKNVLDVGCGLGTWSYVFKQKGINVVGLDWDGVNRDLLVLEENEFIPTDLEKGFQLQEKFDLIICLEVAEHLSEDSSDVFIKSLVNHSDVILFSAAIPNQGGDHHVNEQPFQYWINKFSLYSFDFYDCFRDKFWQNDKVEWWYRQNMFLVSKQNFDFTKVKNPNLYIHPGLFEKKNKEIQRFYDGNHSILTGFKFFLKTILNLFK